MIMKMNLKMFRIRRKLQQSFKSDRHNMKNLKNDKTTLINNNDKQICTTDCKKCLLVVHHRKYYVGMKM